MNVFGYTVIFIKWLHFMIFNLQLHLLIGVSESLSYDATREIHISWKVSTYCTPYNNDYSVIQLYERWSVIVQYGGKYCYQTNFLQRLIFSWCKLLSQLTTRGLVVWHSYAAAEWASSASVQSAAALYSILTAIYFNIVFSINNVCQNSWYVNSMLAIVLYIQCNIWSSY